jgi:hypothetical protein
VSGHDDLRVGDAERTRVTEALHDHFAQGRLTRDELDERLDTTLSAKTYGDLRQITRDLPGPEPVAQRGSPAAGTATPAGPPVRGRRPRGLPLLPLAIGVFVATMLLSGGTMWALFGVLKVIFLVWLVMALVGFVHLRRRRRRGRRSWSQGPWSQGPWSQGPWSQGPWSQGPWSQGPWSQGPWSQGSWSQGSWPGQWQGQVHGQWQGPYGGPHGPCGGRWQRHFGGR